MTIGGQRTMQGRSRLSSLDGLRGIAAFVVLAHHSLFLTPAFSAVQGMGGVPPTAGSVMWWLNYSPLKLFSAGTEAVTVFFVLSGLVLTLPVLKRPGFDWMAYYPQRVVRLTFPVLGSIAFAGVFILLVKQVPFEGPETWLSLSSTPDPRFSQFLSATNLISPGSDNFHVNNPLWSLSWELLFSLALPVFAVIAVAFRRWWIAAIVGAVILTAIGRLLGFLPLMFLPSFAVGCIIAVRFDAIKGFAERVNSQKWRNYFWGAFTLVSLTLLISSWLPGPLSADSMLALALRSLSPLAAGMIVVAGMGWPVLDRLLLVPPLRFAGKISFSLYLTHVPVLIFTSYLLQGSSMALTIFVGDILAVAIATVFFWLIEFPSHSLSRRIGPWASTQVNLNRTTVQSVNR